jgi:mannose-6-phosphate isomerase-like protein (cupin superfamily)
VGEPTAIRPGGGEVVGDSPRRRVEILSDDDALHATWTRFGPGRDGADLHIHRRHTNMFYVLAGELALRLGAWGEVVHVPAGTFARVPPLVVHGFRNAAGEELRYLNFHAPGQGFADYLRALRDGRTLVYDQEPPPADGGRPATEAVVGDTGYTADRDGARVALLADADAVAVAEIACNPWLPAAPAHVHRRHVESFYVLDGEPVFTVGDREFRAEPGSWLQVPPGIRHTVAFPAPEPVRLLNVHTPGCDFGAYLRALDDADEEVAAMRAGFDQQRAP